jgi:hypothetical protein
MERKCEQSAKRHEVIGNILVKVGGKIGKRNEERKDRSEEENEKRKYFREKCMWKITAGKMKRDVVAL